MHAQLKNAMLIIGIYMWKFWEHLHAY